MKANYQERNELTSNNKNYIIKGELWKKIIYNNESKLPSAYGRTWYEADINYEGGARNRQRILYSSDGLIFVSYDHYQTFYEIVK